MLTRDPGKGGKYVKIGEGSGDIFYKKVIHNSHFMREENGYGIQEDRFLEITMRFKYIVLIEDTGWVFKVAVADWKRFGNNKNYGHGLQKFLSMKYYEIIKAPSNFKLSSNLKKNQIVQDNLF